MSDPGTDNTYIEDNQIQVRARFTENIRAAASTTLDLVVGIDDPHDGLLQSLGH